LERLSALVDGGRKALVISAKAIDAAELSVLANSKSFEGGVRSNVDVVNAIQTLFEVKNDYVQSATALALNYLNLLLIAGENLYDPYSAYGPYGRHNREYTVDELERLMVHCGFEREVLFTADVQMPVHDHLALAIDAARSTRETESALGQYVFSRWRNVGPIQRDRPNWLFRSYSEGAELG